jgi:hypothetical protein
MPIKPLPPHRQFPKTPPFKAPIEVSTIGTAGTECVLVAADAELILSTTDATAQELQFLADCVNSTRMREATILALESAVRCLMDMLETNASPTSAARSLTLSYSRRVMNGNVQRRDAPSLYPEADEAPITP